MLAKVYKSTGSWYTVKCDNGTWLNARLKGVFRAQDITSTNPIAVGDNVNVEMETEPAETAVITEIHDRKNYINRQSPSNKMQHHIVAANIDQSILIATLKEPKTSQGFIDRFLVAGESFHIPSIIVLNKSDIYGRKENEKFGAWKLMYEMIGYPVYLMSLSERSGFDEVAQLLSKKTSLLTGHSGVGKSSFINKLLPDFDLKTHEVSNWSGKGMHTTTFAEMYDLSNQGRVIDTPGMREFGLFDINPGELSHYFPEMLERLQGCQFNDCTHIHEPGCAIKKALSEGQIHADRYESYCRILMSLEE